MIPTICNKCRYGSNFIALPYPAQAYAAHATDDSMLRYRERAFTVTISTYSRASLAGRLCGAGATIRVNMKMASLQRMRVGPRFWLKVDDTLDQVLSECLHSHSRMKFISNKLMTFHCEIVCHSQMN